MSGRVTPEQKTVARLMMSLLIPDQERIGDDARWDGVCQTARAIWGDEQARHLMLLASRVLAFTLNRITYPPRRMDDMEFRQARTLWRSLAHYGRHDERVLRLLMKTARQMSPERAYYLWLVVTRYEALCQARDRRLESPDRKLARLADRVQRIERNHGRVRETVN